jgi:hypothetical protein
MEFFMFFWALFNVFLGIKMKSDFYFTASIIWMVGSILYSAIKSQI